MSKNITIIQQNDTHGYIRKHPELFWGKNPSIQEVGGFSRIFSYVKKVRSMKKNVLFVDGGDLFHGTAPLVQTKGEVILPLLKEIELDAFVPGNWDFAYGKQQLAKLVNQVPFSTLACNLTGSRTNQPFVHPYVIKEMNDVKVGLIGVTYPYVHETMPNHFSEGLTFSLEVNEVQQYVDILKQNKVDVIILVSHMGLPLDYKLASLVDGINLILSGHSHDRTIAPIIQKETLIIQSGSSSSFLGQVELILDQGKVTDFKHQLISLKATDFEEDPTINELIDSVMKPFDVMNETVIGRTDTLLHRMTLNESPMDKLITNAYLHSFSGDISFSHGWRYGIPIVPGTITLDHLYNMIPTNPEIFQLEVDGQHLLEILENNLDQVFAADPFQQKGGYILRSSGLMMSYKPYNPTGYRIQYLEVNHQPLQLDKIYQVIGAGEQLFKKLQAKKQFKGIHSIDVIKNYLNDIKCFKYDDCNNIISS